ncbi:hypothetical protein [Agrobacterium sp. SORGH_AS 787]|uniref:Uncharacterized protein n=1 Tax=Agrobacterium larrymoorei TaxID=160699 RepID=A0ABU0UKI5_9HYPH|nr:hypothetical protein [Agrobacterium larrymoorei]MDQ1197939.1 hypothetical protein [Rhizobium sp. SORGH_AS_0787]
MLQSEFIIIEVQLDAPFINCAKEDVRLHFKNMRYTKEVDMSEKSKSSSRNRVIVAGLRWLIKQFVVAVIFPLLVIYLTTYLQGGEARPPSQNYYVAST